MHIRDFDNVLMTEDGMAKETVTNRRCTDEFKVEALRLAESFGQLPQAGPN